tara:strand:- start:4502 stop:5056 length:555 start_codon:yes stop_codon:yes gene_type:complete
MALSKIQSESINLADTFAFTGTVSGAGFTFTAEQSLNGTSGVTFTGIPSGVNIIRFFIENASTALTADHSMQIGDSGGLESANYVRGDMFFASASSIGNGSNTSADSWRLDSWGAATNFMQHNGEIVRVSGNKWFMKAIVLENTQPNYFIIWKGYKELSGELTQLKFYPHTGNFDSGTMYIGYQ